MGRFEIRGEESGVSETTDERVWENSPENRGGPQKLSHEPSKFPAQVHQKSASALRE
jgi:hypothetical protein